MRLSQKVALVTGAAGGIGRAAAWALACEGADLGLNDLAFPAEFLELVERIRALGRRVVLLPADVAEEAAVDAMVARLAAELGRLDVFVSSAVFSEREPFLSADMAGLRRTLEVTLWGTLHGLRAAARQMIRQRQEDGAAGCAGSCVLISSTQALRPVPGSLAYNMAKAAVDQMARTAAAELAPQRVRVNLLHPGWVDTPGERKFYGGEVLKKAAELLPWGRLATAEEIARGVVFLADPAADYITGSTLTIDGGFQLPAARGLASPRPGPAK